MFFQAVSATVKRSGGTPPPSSPIAFRGFTATCLPNIPFAQGFPATVNLPSTAVSGDFVVLVLAYDSTITANSVSSTGWTKLIHVGDADPDAQFDVFYRIFNGTEGSTATFETNLTLGTRDVHSYAFIVDNIDTSNPFSIIGTPAKCTSCTTLSTTGITATSDGRVIGLMAYDGGVGEPFTISSGWTLLVEAECDSTGSGLGVNYSYKNLINGQASGQLDFAVSPTSFADGMAAVQLFMKQA